MRQTLTSPQLLQVFYLFILGSSTDCVPSGTNYLVILLKLHCPLQLGLLLCELDCKKKKNEGCCLVRPLNLVISTDIPLLFLFWQSSHASSVCNTDSFDLNTEIAPFLPSFIHLCLVSTSGRQATRKNKASVRFDLIFFSFRKLFFIFFFFFL